MNFKENRLYLYLGLVAILSWGFVKLTEVDIEEHFFSQKHSADYFSNNYTKWEMSDTGSLKSKLTTENLIHYSDDKTLHTLNPVMIFYNETSSPWVIKAQSGILSADGKDLQLNGNVIIDRAKAEGVTAITLKTRNVKVNPETSYAQTDEFAELISQDNTTTGIGMKMTYIKPVHLELLANVKGKYETK
jgi:lipopolysaccharide export system protein LptC